MKRAIWPAGLALLALVLCAAAPAPDVRAAPPRTVPHGDAARPRAPLPSALHGRPLGDRGREGPASRSTGRTTSSSGPTTAGVRRRCTALASVRAGPCSIRTDSRSPRRARAGSRLRRHQLPRRLERPGFDRRGARRSGRDRARSRRDHDLDAARRAGRADARIRRDELPRCVDNQAGETDVYGARVSPSGTVLDPAGIEIAVDAGFQYFAVGRLRRDELPRRLGGRPVPPHHGQAGQPRRRPGRRR